MKKYAFSSHKSFFFNKIVKPEAKAILDNPKIESCKWP